jgi:hypothetical protein
VGDLGRLLVGFGLVMLVAGLILIAFGRAHIPLGRLPGDIVYRGKSTTVYFPMVTSLLLSVVLSLVFYLINRFRH